MFRSLAFASIVLALAGHALAAGPKQVQAPFQAPIQKAPIQAPKPQVVTKTIMVPHVEYQTRTVPDVICTPVVRQKTVPITRMVPETHMVVRRIPHVTHEPRTRIQTYTVCHMEYDLVKDVISVPVPYTEMRQGTRTVCNMVAETVMQTITEETGHYEDVPSKEGPIQKGGPEQGPLQKGPIQKERVWVPEIIKKQVPRTVYRPEYSQVPYEYPVTLTRYESRPITRTIPRPRYETKHREIHFTVPVTNYVEREVPYTVCRPVVDYQVVNYTEIVRTPTTREITVPVCTMVPKTITYTIEACETCDYGKF
jgi:hypothetical protein